ncbi:hypothetical protein B296_00035936 [Ensete ventricosum]|uniref:Uncharacterized protein n=1 Tax=Ensete ventricosum TaxID=4639 RepID=A0A427A495_ENSVE|nr:hypothetical protein B296_00035936 [Ensete ventricosum]
MVATAATDAVDGDVMGGGSFRCIRQWRKKLRSSPSTMEGATHESNGAEEEALTVEATTVLGFMARDSDEQESNNTSSMTLSKKNSHQIHEQHKASQQHTSVKKQGEDDPVSDDENQGNRRGRSKLERWTSHKERDYDAINNSQTLSASSRGKKIEGNVVDVAKADELVKTELTNNAGELDVKGADGGQVSVKMVDDQDRHLDTVAKLKRRSERFKLPMPREKEITSNKKMENEVQLSNNEVGLNSEVKPERPARKRRWTGS